MTQSLRPARLFAATAVAILLGAADVAPAQQSAAQQPAAQPGATRGRLLTRRSASVASRPRAAEPTGLRALIADTGREVLVHVPAGYAPQRPAPLLVMLHGAGGSPSGGLRWVVTLADSAGVIVVAPKSLGMTWDVVRGQYGPDVTRIDHALTEVLATYAVDTTRLAIGGFSDGATYALSLGITNGDLFTHVIAFSPGFMVPMAQRGEPHLFVSHGTRDRILAIDACSRRIVRRVKDAGYDVVYREFDGGHTVPPEVARAAIAWLTGDRGARSGR